MNDIKNILLFPKEDLLQASRSLTKDSIHELVDMLSLKEDNIRYQAFLMLQNRSANFDDVYPYWDVFTEKLKSDNSYQRSIGLMLIAENARWDSQNKINDDIDNYLKLLNDEKPITVRQAIQSLIKIVESKPALSGKIAKSLMELDIIAIRESMRKPILTDILNTLIVIRKYQRTDDIESYINGALSGGILDKKTKAQLEKML